MGKMKGALMDWCVDEGYDICAEPYWKPTLRALAVTKKRSDEKLKKMRRENIEENTNQG